MDIVAIMKERHSVRQYKNQVIDHSKREEINAFVNAINAESKLAIQVFYDEPKCFDSFMAHYGKFENVKNYIAIVGNKEDQEKKDIMMVREFQRFLKQKNRACFAMEEQPLGTVSELADPTKGPLVPDPSGFLTSMVIIS